MPYSGIPDVKTAWAVIQRSGCGNVGLLLDSWHWIRAGQDYSDACREEDPAERIVAVQLNDVQAHPYPAAVLRDESMHDRLLPGTGSGNTADFVRMLKEKGVQPRVITADVISDELLNRGLNAAAFSTYQSLKAVLCRGELSTSVG